MKKVFIGGGKNVGQSPGTLIHLGDLKADAVTINLMTYDVGGVIDEKDTMALEEITSELETGRITWISVIGLHQIDIIERFGEIFNLHPLMLEDILNTNQRPKIESYGDYLFLTLKILHWLPDLGTVEPEQISIVLGENYILTFQEQPLETFDPIRQSIRDGKGRIRGMGVDYLAYRLIDTIVDHYFLILENLNDQIDSLEEELVSKQTPAMVAAIHQLRRELLFIRKSVWPLREVLGGLQRGESPLFQQATIFFLRDVYDHTIQIIDTLETFRDIVSGLLDIYLSSVSNSTNQVMKVLTIIATIFIPLTFITSLYGMNFKYMPELQWRWGYFLVWLILIAISIGMLAYFRRKNWL